MDNQIPPLTKLLISALLQKGLTALATVVTGWVGWSAFQTSSWVQELLPFALMLVLWLLSFAWTWIHTEAIQWKMRVLQQSKPPKA